MTEAVADPPLAPLPLTQAQLDAIKALNPGVFGQITGQAAEEDKRPERVIVKAARDSRLEALLAQYRPFKDERDAAKAKFDDLVKAITAEVEDMYPAEVRPSKGFEIPATAMNPALTINYVETDYLPSGKIREFLPAVYQAFKGVKRYSEVRESTRGQRRGPRK